MHVFRGFIPPPIGTLSWVLHRERLLKNSLNLWKSALAMAHRTERQMCVVKTAGWRFFGFFIHRLPQQKRHLSRRLKLFEVCSFPLAHRERLQILSQKHAAWLWIFCQKLRMQQRSLISNGNLRVTLLAARNLCFEALRPDEMMDLRTSGILWGLQKSAIWLQRRSNSQLRLLCTLVGLAIVLWTFASKIGCTSVVD